jgi:hypothetical protein
MPPTAKPLSCSPDRGAKTPNPRIPAGAVLSGPPGAGLYGCTPPVGWPGTFYTNLLASPAPYAARSLILEARRSSSLKADDAERFEVGGPTCGMATWRRNRDCDWLSRG